MHRSVTGLWVVLLLVFIVEIGPLGAESLSLNQIYSLALKNNEDIQISREEIRYSKLDKRRAISTVFPRVSIIGSYTRYPEEIGILGGQSFPIQSEKSHNIEATIEQDLYAGGKNRAGIRMANQTIRATQHEFNEASEALLVRIAQLFYDVLKAQENLEAQERNVERLEEHRRLSDLRVKVGEVTKTVLLRAEAELAEAQADQFGLETGLVLKKDELQIVANLPDEYELSDPDLPEIPREGLEQLIQNALENRDDVRRFQLQESIAKENLKFARGNFLPTVTLNGNYFWRGPDTGSPFFIDESWFVGGRLTIPIFEGGLRLAEYSQARTRLEQSRLNRQRLKKEVGLDVTRAILALEAVTKTLTARQKQHKFSRQNMEMVEKQFTFGVATNIDLLDANQTLITAERDVIQATYNQHVAILNLQRSAGLFLPKVMEKIQDRL